MPESERPSAESKTEMVARHHKELKSSGYTLSAIKKWGGVAAALMAIIALCAQVGPWVVDVMLGDLDETIHQNTKATKALNDSVKELDALLKATIDMTSDRVHDGDLRDERLHGSIEALRNEVRIRHGQFDFGYGIGAVGASGGGRAPASTRRTARAPSRREQIKAVVQKADEKIQAVQESKPRRRKLADQIKAKL
jgi:hypothetical protein